jgi:hypothetical protein
VHHGAHAIVACRVCLADSLHIEPLVTARRLVQHRAWLCERRGVHRLQDGRHAGNCFQAPNVATVAASPVSLQRQVTDFAGPEMVTMQESTLEHDAGTEALFAFDDDEIAIAMPGPEVILGHGRGRGVIQDAHG